MPPKAKISKAPEGKRKDESEKAGRNGNKRKAPDDSEDDDHPTTSTGTTARDSQKRQKSDVRSQCASNAATNDNAKASAKAAKVNADLQLQWLGSPDEQVQMEFESKFQQTPYENLVSTTVRKDTRIKRFKVKGQDYVVHAQKNNVVGCATYRENNTKNDPKLRAAINFVTVFLNNEDQ